MSIGEPAPKHDDAGKSNMFGASATALSSPERVPAYETYTDTGGGWHTFAQTQRMAKNEIEVKYSYNC